jgi:hypothetical protein
MKLKGGRAYFGQAVGILLFGYVGFVEFVYRSVVQRRYDGSV